MAGAGYKLFNTGDVLLASEVNTYLMQQTVMVFANSTARTSALSGVLAEGMISYLADTNATEVYNGTAWVGITGTGDITEVTAGTGISGGGTTGAVTITNSMATEITAKGDLIVGTGNATFDNLAVGTNNYVLTADSSTSTGLKWAAAAGGGKVLQVVSATYAVSTSTSTQNSDTDTGLSVAITPSAASSKVLVIVTQNAGVARSGSNLSIAWKLLRNATVVYTNDRVLVYVQSGNNDSKELIAVAAIAYLDSPSTTSSTTYKTQMRLIDPGTVTAQVNGSTSSIIAMEIGAQWNTKT